MGLLGQQGANFVTEGTGGQLAYIVDHPVHHDGQERDVANDLVRKEQRRLAQPEGAAQHAVPCDGQYQQADQHVAVMAR